MQAKLSKPGKHLKITIIGAGNVATQLGLALLQSHHHIIQVYSKSSTPALRLAKLLKCDYTVSPQEINTTSDIYIIAVNDDAIKQVAKEIELSSQIVVHTSGSVEMDILKNVSKNYGVFYPLQTFSKSKKANFKNIPICLEANNKSTLEILKMLAGSISTNVQHISSEQRKTIHLAAVFACNFSNHLYAIAKGILEKNNLSLDILKPLIEETAAKIKTKAPAQMQTGPAVRGDKKIMKRHLHLLSNNKQLKELYKFMSQSIIDLNKQNK